MPVERHIREILEGGQSSLLEADMSRRLDMLVRQGLMPVSKLPLLKRGLEKLQLGKVGSPQEREAVSSLLNSMMFIVLGDDTVFNRARQHTQKNRYQAEESENVEECKDEEDFKPHMMYDPKTGKGYKANKYEDHVRMDKMGYTHDKPKMKEEMDMCDCDCECDGNICETCGLMKPVLEGSEYSMPAEKSKEETKKIKDKMRAKAAMKPKGYQEEYDTPAKKKKVSQMTDAEKKANDERRKAYNEFQKKNRMNEDEENDFRHLQQDSTELNGDGNRDRGRYGEDLTGDKEMFQFQPGNPFAKVKKEMQEGMYKRMATDAEEDDRLKAQKKAARLSKKMAKQEKETDPGLKEAEDKFEELLEKNVPTNPKLWSKFKAQAKAKFDVYPSAYANGWAAKKYKAAGGSWRSESVEFDELVDQLDEYITSKQVKMARGIANDPRYKGGDMTGAAKKMEKIKKGLSNHPGAKKALRLANEGVFDDYTDEELDELIEMEYKAKFQAMLKKTGKSLASMSPDEKKKFFNSVDAAHSAKNESYTMKNTYAKSGAMAKDKASHNTGGFRISNKDAAAAKQRLMQKKGMKMEDAASDAKRDYDADDKKGMAPLKKDKPAKVSSASNAKEIEHIVPQLRKAITVGKEVQFQDGKTHKVSKGHAAKFLNKYMNSKPAQKSDMQSSAHKSHDHFMKHV